MDALWLCAPGLALRLSEGAPGWQLNPAAEAWATRRHLGAADWSALAQALRGALPATAGAGAHQGHAEIGPTAVALGYTAVPLGEGWLVWLDPEVSEVERATVAVTERWVRAMDLATVAVWRLEYATDRAYFSDWGYRMLGMEPPPESLSIAELRSLIHPDDLAHVLRAAEEARQSSAGVDVEARYKHRDGSYRHLLTRRVAERNEDGQVIALSGVMLDQTERIAERERARLAAESAGIGTWERDLRRGVARWDAQMYRLRGLPVGTEELTVDLRSSTLHPDDLEAVQRRDTLIGRDGDSYKNEFRVVHPDGSVHWLASRGLVKRDAQGQPERLLGVSWDVTESRRTEQALRDKAAAEQASQAKSEFLARMSHELRTPLNAVLGFSQLLTHDPGEALSPRQAERVQRIHSAGLHLLALIDDVLDLATIESDTLSLAQEPVSLQASLGDVLQWTQLQAAQAGVAVSAQDLPGWVWGDARRVRQVLANLVSNAIKYNRTDGEVWVSAQTSRHQGHDAWRISVRDSGRGLSPAQCAQLFEPFNRLGAEHGAIPGTGIGLAIVRHLVRLMGGEVTVASQPGQGSEFSVTLLRAEPPGEGAAHAPLSGFQNDLHGLLPSTRLRMLYIEDNPVNALLVQELLALRTDVSLAIAPDGRSGVAQALASHPHVVLIDMQLPDIDGFEVLRQLRGNAALSNTSFVALSANAMAEDVSRALAAGFDDYWTKPIDFHAFLRAVTVLVRRHVT